jgi:hypothetical protein|tara:strand:- start:120 stop:503 length:384 start_codon:yes stop_codon:yes gene_type:complete
MALGVTTIGLNTVVDNLQRDMDAAIEKELRARALQAFADVKLATPVDTGISRNSWYIGYTETYINAKSGGAGNIQLIQKKDKPTEIIVTNGVTYIQFLNNGHSQQAPTKFIEAAFSKYFDEVKVTVV